MSNSQEAKRDDTRLRKASSIQFSSSSSSSSSELPRVAMGKSVAETMLARASAVASTRGSRKLQRSCARRRPRCGDIIQSWEGYMVERACCTLITSRLSPWEAAKDLTSDSSTSPESSVSIRRRMRVSRDRLATRGTCAASNSSPTE